MRVVLTLFVLLRPMAALAAVPPEICKFAQDFYAYHATTHDLEIGKWVVVPGSIAVECLSASMDEAFGDGTLHASVTYQVMNRSRERVECSGATQFRLRRSAKGWIALIDMIDTSRAVEANRCDGARTPPPADDPLALKVYEVAPESACNAARTDHLRAIKGQLLRALRQKTGQDWVLDEPTLTVTCHDFAGDEVFKDGTITSLAQFEVMSRDRSRLSYAGEHQTTLFFSGEAWKPTQSGHSGGLEYSKIEDCKVGRCPSRLIAALGISPDVPEFRLTDLLCAEMVRLHIKMLESRGVEGPPNEHYTVSVVSKKCEEKRTIIRFIEVPRAMQVHPVERESVAEHDLAWVDGRWVDTGERVLPEETDVQSREIQSSLTWAYGYFSRCTERHTVPAGGLALQLSWSVLNGHPVNAAFAGSESPLTRCLLKQLRFVRFSPEIHGEHSAWVFIRPPQATAP